MKFIHSIIVILLCCLPNKYAYGKIDYIVSTTTRGFMHFDSDSIQSLTGKVYNGDFKITKITFSQPADYSNSKFAQKLYLDKVVYFKDCFFVGSTFKKINVSYSKFLGYADFGTSIFTNPYFALDSFYDISFGHARFNGFAYFLDVNMQKADFSKCKFEKLAISYGKFGDLFFNEAIFDEDLAIWDIDVANKADFSKAKFKSKVNFRSIFNTISFSNATFDNDISFANSRMKSKLSLNHLNVTNPISVDFNYTHLPDTIDLSQNDMSGNLLRIDFTKAWLETDTVKDKRNFVLRYLFPYDTNGDSKKHQINLYNTEIPNIKIDYRHFKIFMVDVYNTTLSIDKCYSVYEALLQNFKKNGQLESYELLDIEYQRFKRNLRPNEFCLEDWWWRFGYKKERVFIHSFLLIIIFSIVNFFFIHNLNDRENGVYNIDQLPQFNSLKNSKITLRWVLRRLRYSLIYTSAIFFLLTLKIDKIKFQKRGALWIISIYTVGLICIGFMANLILKK